MPLPPVRTQNPLLATARGLDERRSGRCVPPAQGRIPEYEAKRYEGRVRAGKILVSVHCDNSDWVSRTKDILRRTGAEDVSSAGEAGDEYARNKPVRETRY